MAHVAGAAMEEGFRFVIGEPGCIQDVECRRTDQEMKKKKKSKMNMNRKKINNLLKIKKTMKTTGKEKTMMKTLINVETKMNMKKSIETNPMLNMKRSTNVNENINELEFTHESHDESEEECEDEAEYDAVNGELPIVLGFGSKAIIKCVAVHRPMFGNEYCRSTSTDDFRSERPTMHMVSL
jgi:hypothetical protein